MGQRHQAVEGTPFFGRRRALHKPRRDQLTVAAVLGLVSCTRHEQRPVADELPCTRFSYFSIPIIHKPVWADRLGSGKISVPIEVSC